MRDVHVMYRTVRYVVALVEIARHADGNGDWLEG